jgi:hypothetical protein
VWLREKRWLRSDLLSLALLPVGAASYIVYCWIAFGDPLAYLKTSKAGWHGGIHLVGLARGWELFSDPTQTIYFMLAILCLVAVPFVWRTLGPPYAAFVLLSVLAPVLEFPTLNSLGRYLSVIFPAFFLLAYLLRRRPLVLYNLAFLCLIALVYCAALFIAGWGLS